MKYILRRLDQGGGYVTPSGSNKAYTRDKWRARRYDTIEDAELDRCIGNEIIEELEL